jgi:hypothetical protein
VEGGRYRVYGDGLSLEARARGEGITQRSSWRAAEGERSREHRLSQRLTASAGVRTLSRSKALKPGSCLRKGSSERLFTEPSPFLEGALRLTLCSVAQAAHWFYRMTSVVLRTPVDVCVAVQGRASKLRTRVWRVGRREDELGTGGLSTGWVSLNVRWLANGKRATTVERRSGWLRGKSFGGQNPMGGCGVKQSHEAQVG